MNVFAKILHFLLSAKGDFDNYLNKKDLAARTSIDDNATQKPLLKSQILGVVFMSGFLVLGLRVSYVAIFRQVDIARSSAKAETERLRPRADITDRNGVLMATSLTSYSLYADPVKNLGSPRNCTGNSHSFP